jgi:hypothetical protein
MTGAAVVLSVIAPSVEKAPDGAAPQNTTGAPTGARKSLSLEKPDEQQDDDDEREKSATDVHSVLLCAVDLGTTAAAPSGLRGTALATMPAATAPWPSG